MALLLSPMMIANLKLKNRVALSPMRTHYVQKHDGVLNPLHFAYYGARAIEQVGLVIIEPTAVTPEGQVADTDLGLWNEKQAKELKKLVDFLHSLGAKVGILLSNAGRKMTTETKLADFVDEQVRTKALAEISAVQAAFVAAAKRAQQAGVDMIEIQCDDGLFLDDLVAPCQNAVCMYVCMYVCMEKIYLIAIDFGKKQ